MEQTQISTGVQSENKAKVNSFLNKIKNSKFLAKLDISYSSALLSIAIIAVMLLILFEPVTYAKSVTDGISLFFTAVFPGLLPFMFLTKLLTSLQTMPKLAKSLDPISQKLFGINGNGMYAFLMSIISGYPIGAKITADLYGSGKLPKDQLLRVALISSTSGPIFVIGAVGGEFLGSTRLGVIIFVSNILACIMTAFLISRPKNKRKTASEQITQHDVEKGLSFIGKLKESFSRFFTGRKQKQTTIEKVISDKAKQNEQSSQVHQNEQQTIISQPNRPQELNIQIEPLIPHAPQINYVTSKAHKYKNKNKAKSTQVDISLIIKDCIISLLVVGFYITIFSLFIDLLTNLNVVSFLSKTLDPIFSLLKINSAFELGTMSGIIEMTNGAKMLSSTLSIESVSLISFIISFSGISIIMQSLTFLSKTPIKKSRFVFGKLLQACFSYLICFILLHIF